MLFPLYGSASPNMEANLSGISPDESARTATPRDGAGDLHPRLLAVEALVGWLPSFVANRVRTQALRTAGIDIGEATLFFGLPKLVGRGAVHTRLKVGTYCGFNKGAFFDLEETITIGDHVAVGHDVMFLTRSYERGPASRRAGALRCAPIVIGDGVWLGARTMILPGVTVGAGSVISAGIAIAEDVPENTLLTGTQRVSIARWRK
jgi:maltose O-acetyltransferase